MSAKILDGVVVRDEKLKILEEKISRAVDQGKRRPGLAVILVGGDAASRVYVNNKERTCEKIGIQSHAYHLNAKTTEGELLELIDLLNETEQVHGILVQLPLPPHMNSDRVIERIKVSKDVDGFVPHSMGSLALNKAVLSPCTPRGVMHLLAYYDINLQGKDVLIIGASRIVGRPMVLEMLNAGATVTVCTQTVQDLRSHVERAEVLVVAAGARHLVQGAWIREGAVVVDVGIHRSDDGTFYGDVDFESACQRAAWITPVPGGVGPMTIAQLMENTVIAAGL